MHILVLGAGGIGGYFGARLHDAGADVTFLVRPERAAQLRSTGLHVISPFGDMQFSPQVVTREEIKTQFDVIMLSCKAYDLDSAMQAIEPALGPHSVILPLLNGICHIDTLAQRFGSARVLGGIALISVLLAPDGEIRHLNKMHRLITGSRCAPESKWLKPLAGLLEKSGIDFVLSADVEQAMWDKIVFLSTLAGATCMMRASIGDIMHTLAGESLINALLAECAEIARASGHVLDAGQLSAYHAQLTDPGSALMASMLRDVERGGPTEADHILGDMVTRANALSVDVPQLKLAYSHLQAYDRRRAKTQA